MGDVAPAWGGGFPAGFDDFLAAVFSGETYPDGSETAAWQLSQQYADFHRIIVSSAGDYVTAAMQVAAGWDGATGQSFEQFARELAGEGGLLAAADNALVYSQQIDNFAAQTQYSKYSINAAFYVAAAAVFAALVAAFFSFGAAAAALGPIGLAARSTVTRIIAELVMSVSRTFGVRAVGSAASRPLVAPLLAEGIEETGEELLIDIWSQLQQGRGWDWQKTLAAGLGGLFGGILGMRVFTPLVEAAARRTPGLRQLVTAGLDAAGRPVRGIVPAFQRFPGRAFVTGSSNAFTSPIASFFANAVAYGEFTIPSVRDGLNGGGGEA